MLYEVITSYDDLKGKDLSSGLLSTEEADGMTLVITSYSIHYTKLYDVSLFYRRLSNDFNFAIGFVR